MELSVATIGPLSRGQVNAKMEKVKGRIRRGLLFGGRIRNQNSGETLGLGLICLSLSGIAGNRLVRWVHCACRPITKDQGGRPFLGKKF